MLKSLEENALSGDVNLRPGACQTSIRREYLTSCPIVCSQVRAVGHLNPMGAIIQDEGLRDGVRRILFGSGFPSFWLLKLVFLDSISYLSHGEFNYVS